jgi:hypothetical protein
MPAAWVVPPLDVCEQREVCFRLGHPAAPIDQFTLECGEEALGHRVVVGIADRTHRMSQAHLSAAVAERNIGVLGGFNRETTVLSAHPGHFM